MGNKSSSMLQDDEIQLISSETGFTPTQIEKLYARFTSLDKEAVGSLSREDFLRVPELAINPLCNRIVEMFFTDFTDGLDPLVPDNNDRINFRQFMKVLATFRASNGHNHKSNGHAKVSNKVSNASTNSNNSNNSNNNNSYYPNNNNPDQHNRSQHNHSGSSLNGVEFSQANSVAILSQSHLNVDHAGAHGGQGGLSRISSSPHSMYKSGGSLLDVFHDNHIHRNRKVSSPIYSLHDSNDANHNHHNGHHNHHFRPFYDEGEPKNSRKHKLYFMFRLYDVDNDNRISYDDLKCILKQMVGSYIDEAHTNKIVTRAFLEVDKDGDNHINFDEFCQVFEGNDIDEKLKINFSH